MSEWIKYSCRSIRYFNVESVGYIMEYECTCPDGATRKTQIIAPWTDESLDTDVLRLMSYCPTAPPPPTLGCQITHVQYPATLKLGEEVTVKVSVKNTGSVKSKYDVQLIEEDTGKIIDTEPDLLKKEIGPGAISTIEVNSIGWFGAMPNHPWNLNVRARRIT